MGYHIWSICCNKETLWVKWIDVYRLKGNSLWGVKKKSTDSWIWRKFLRLRVLIKPFIDVSIDVLRNERVVTGRRVTPNIQNLQNSRPQLQMNMPDVVQWRGKNEFKCKEFWKEIREDTIGVPWHKVVSDCSVIPIHSFIT
ncbi:hypothetical protein LIER_08969 [Lithospermum erythrorhizon]|uniref:Uncharacterized protein n=1 Tax=Lithospermum erythrorhizon TaxID=34254 RepID=A0AAV3PHX3_LITER